MSTALVAVQPQSGFTQEQIDIIKSQVAPKGTTNDELAMFLMYCQRTGLDPFARQIYLSERRSRDGDQWKVTRKPETTVDGFRLSAERTKQYAGQLGPFWCGEDGQWRDVWIPAKGLIASKVGVLRHDFKEPLWAVALYDEYVQTKADGNPNSMWAKMPANQLAKCAESLALRRAFPRELSGLYTREEMPAEEERGTKQAQQDYLRSKGIGIDARSGVRDSPDGGTDGLEARAASESVSPSVKSPTTTKAKKGAIAFDALKKWGELKKEVIAVMGNADLYYTTLGVYNYKHSNEIQSKEDATAIWKLIGAGLNKAKQDNELLKTLQEAGAVLGAETFNTVCNGMGIDEIMALDSDALVFLLENLKATATARKSKS